MNQATPFVISEFTNPSGEVVFRVSGWLQGKRIRKNFGTRPEAEAERQVLEIQCLQAESGLRTAVTRLTDTQLHDAEAAFRRLGDRPKSLLFYLDYALANYREPAREQPLVDAADAYLAVKRREHEQHLLSDCQFTTIRRHLAVLQNHFPDATVAQLSAERLATYCQHGIACPKTYNNRRGVLSTFLKFAFQKDWIAVNPIEKIPHHRIAHRRGSARTLTAGEAQKLMAFVENYRGGILVPFFALCLFAGIRPCLRTGEILKLRPEHIRLDTRVIHIEPEVSKVRMKRNVTIQPNLAAWLRAYPLDEFPLIPTNMQHLRADVARRFNFSHDVMRHTFISMFVAKFRSMGEAALQAGNSEGIIRKHYLDLKNPKEAKQFFSIMPKRRAGRSTATLAPPAPAPALAIAV